MKKSLLLDNSSFTVLYSNKKLNRKFIEKIKNENILVYLIGSLFDYEALTPANEKKLLIKLNLLKEIDDTDQLRLINSGETIKKEMENEERKSTLIYHKQDEIRTAIDTCIQNPKEASCLLKDWFKDTSKKKRLWRQKNLTKDYKISEKILMKKK